MQLTNILRDVREDSRRGRTYLPAADLRRFGCQRFPDGPLEPTVALMRFEAQRAQAWFDRGLELVAHVDARSASCVLAMTGIYRTILDRIEANPQAVLWGRISLSTGEKTWVAARSLARARGKGTGTRRTAVGGRR